jgi:tRNA G10  N-methylase Trm11
MNATTLFELDAPAPNHPAKYTDVLLPVMARMLQGRQRILDPFGGTGKVFLLDRWLGNVEIQATEIEPEWAAKHPRTTLGNALHLPWPDGYFDAVCTSPTYGNRMADGLRNPENWAREYNYITYSQKLNRKLHADNSGGMQWGDKYRAFHASAWAEAHRVLGDDGVFVLNIKDHIRAGEFVKVTDWHIECLQGLGFRLVEHRRIDTPSMRYGQNSELRVPYESVILFEKVQP